ncbi:MAG: type II secretion system F family protein [Sideroxyarcus sp.]|nr:type II secretion system F family protein [Sideroxyarcus sp.]
MLNLIETLVAQSGLGAVTLAMVGAGFGALIAVLGLSTALSQRNPVLQRIAMQANARVSVADKGLLRHANADPKGLMKSLIPQNRKERSEVERQLSHAGFQGQHAIRNYYLIRLFLGIVFPALLLGMIWASRAGFIALPESLDARIAGYSQSFIMMISAITVAVGFFGPVYWLRGRAAERQHAISDSFPNALDLIQISVESGLGFDAAMIRVGNELEHTAPEIAEELLAAQREIQAGRSRDKALRDMANRTGVEEVVSFANVVLQSIQFGTSIAETLTIYAQEMRVHRELRAQEMANKLPVKLSAIMASLMLPALIMLTLGPVVIRYMRQFSG